jgi:hypothetical protein
VRLITSDGIIRGTYQYKGTKELDGAEPANKSNAFSSLDGTRRGAVQDLSAYLGSLALLAKRR